MRAWFLLEAEAGISGRVTTHEGTPARKVRIELLRKHYSGGWYSDAAFWTETNADGNYRFKRLPVGEYLLGYSIWSDLPYDDSALPTWYYPRVGDRAKAKILHLRPLQTVQNINLTLGKPDTPRKIRIQVVWPDGSPPGDHLLQISNQGGLLVNLEGKSSRPRGGHAELVHGNGDFTFVGYQERSYELSCRYWVDNLGDLPAYTEERIAESNVVKVPAGTGDTTVKLVLKEVERR